jgi:hypothetical protein
MVDNPAWATCERVVKVRAQLDDHPAGGRASATDGVAKAQAVRSESELVPTKFDVGLFPPSTPPGGGAPGKRRPRLAPSHNDDNIPRHGHPVFRHSHQTAAASKRQAPRGSGTRNMPQVASATGDLIPRKFVMSSGAPASGQGDKLNKVLTPGAGNDWRMVNAPPRSTASHSHGMPRQIAGWPGAWLTGLGRRAILTRHSVCANNPGALIE